MKISMFQEYWCLLLVKVTIHLYYFVGDLLMLRTDCVNGFDI